MVTRKALGKGLSALIPDVNNLDNGKEQFFQCPIAAIEPNPYQPREGIAGADLDQMVLSVREKGIITPLLVSRTDNGYQLIAGERRWRAAQKAGLERVPVVVKDVTPTEALELAIIENIHRKDLNAIEEALAYQKLLEEDGATQESVARRLGKDRTSITNLLRLLKLPGFIQKDLIDGRLHMGHARVLVGLHTAKEQRPLRDMIINRGLSVRQAEAVARRMKAPQRSKSKRGTLDAYTLSLADNLKRSLGTKVDIRKRGRGGQIIIYYYSDEELDRVLELLE